MRKVVLAMQITLDGFVAGPNEEMDWMIFNDQEQWRSLFNVIRSVDTFLLGAGMYPGYASYWRTVLANPSAYSKNDLEFAQFADKTPHLVFSKTLKSVDWENTRIVKGDVKEEVQKLKQQPGKDMVLLGGAKFASTFINLGLVDEFWFRVNQVILGGGKNLFGNIRERTNLKLLGTETFKSGVVELHYAKI